MVNSAHVQWNCPDTFRFGVIDMKAGGGGASSTPA